MSQEKTIAITRSKDDSEEFIELITKHNATPITLPTIELVSKGEKIVDDFLNSVKTENPDYSVFMSSKAVKLLIESSKKISKFEELRLAIANTIVIAVGPKTKEALENEFEISVNCPEENYDSEHLIKNNIFDNLQNKKVLIIRGKGGRETLKYMLEKKGAKVDYGECYIRNYLTIEQEKLNRELKNCTTIFILISSYGCAFQLEQSPNQWIGDYKTKFIVNHKKIEFSLRNGNYRSHLDDVIVTNDLSAKSLLEIIQNN